MSGNLLRSVIERTLSDGFVSRGESANVFVLLQNLDNKPLETGLVIDCEFFSAIVVREDLLLVFASELPEYASEGSTVELFPRGSNVWAMGLDYVDDLLLMRDVHGVVTAEWVPDAWDDWYDDFPDYECMDPLYHLVDAFDDYRSLSSPARIPRADRAFACRHKSGGRRRR